MNKLLINKGLGFEL